MSRLSTLKIAALVKTGRRGHFGDGGGLFLQVGATGAASWVYRYQRNGKRREMGLGPLGLVSLAEARQKAQAFGRSRLDGGDPLGNRQRERAQAKLDAARAMTFRDCAEAYIAAHRAGWKNPVHAAQWPATLATYAYPVFGSLPVAEVDTGLVTKAIEPIWSSKPETAGRVRGRIEAVLDWAKARGYRAGENPARWKGHLDQLLPPRRRVARIEHHAALPYREMSAFLMQLREQNGLAARALEFAILTAARTKEALGARWSEIDEEGRLWVIPAERMKGHREHRVPLSEPAMRLLRVLHGMRQGEFVFPGQRVRRPLSSMAMAMVLRRMKRNDLTVHGFRSTFSDWVAECTSFPAEVREMALAHTVGSKVEAAYRRGDLFAKRRDLAEAWARFCEGKDDRVVAFSAARRA